jgi:CheY-like chemotaxis protein
MNVLLVEDDEFKAADLTRVLEELDGGLVISRAASVTSALRNVTEGKFDMVILDMSLPTFDLSGPGGGGSPQGQGGIEVLRLSKWLGQNIPFIVITQYPDIEIDGVDVPLPQAAGRLSKRFLLQVEHCISYEFDSDLWREQLITSVNKIRTDSH